MSASGDAPSSLLAGLPALLRDLAAAGVVEFEVSVGDARLFVRQRPGALPVVMAAVDPASAAAEEELGLIAVVTPLAGTFYTAPSPDDPPYAKEGDEVEAGQVVALVEAMKVFNEIHVETAGTVVKLLVSAGQSVQVGQVLMKIRPQAGGAETDG